ncbi:uncharacterized protein [Eurosta solidaginis]|uniref:uncharacterized protein n=1 Tax=Eurosta solidaginis TaxID=178769 RepID=UPI003530A4BD
MHCITIHKLYYQHYQLCNKFKTQINIFSMCNMYSIAFYLDFDENTNKDARRTRKQVRDKAVEVLRLPDDVFVKQFRLNKLAFQYVLDILRREMPPARNSWSISPELKLESCLRFFAEGGYQNGTGQDFNIGKAQSTVSTALSDVLNILEATLCPRLISLTMTEAEKLEAKRRSSTNSKDWD